MQLRRRWAGVVAVLAVVACGAPAGAWFAQGHGQATRAVEPVVRNRLPAFFTAGLDAVVHSSADPDVFKEVGLEPLGRTETPEHYLDFELLEGASLPRDRYAFLKLCFDKQLDPVNVGTLPYAITEATQRLTFALAEHRRWPDNPYIQRKCLVYAGLLAHYAEDLCQPLHTTVHYDGQADAQGESPRSGIHVKVDALFGRLSVEPGRVLRGVSVSPYGDVWTAVQREFEASHALVDRVYELEAELPGLGDTGPLTPAVQAFAEDRLQAAARFTAALYLTAWVDSARIELPRWHERPESEREKEDPLPKPMPMPQPQPPYSPRRPASPPSP